jgi:hypothetical protein
MAKPGWRQFVGDRWTLILASCVGTALAHVGTTTMPFQIGALMDGAGRSASQAGLFGFGQIGALAIGMILISSQLDRVHPVAVAVGGALLATVANAGLFLVQSFPLQLFYGTLAGVGFGFVFAATIAGAAACDEADRLYGIGNGGGLFLIMLIMMTLPVVAASYGPRSIFIGIAALVLVCLGPLFGLKHGRRSTSVGRVSWRTEGIPGLLFSWVALSMGTGALYSFSERIGTQIHLVPEVIGVVLSAGLFVGLFGTAIAALVGERVRRSHALVVGMAGTGVSCLILGYSESLLVFGAGVFLYMLFYMFLYCYLLRTAAQIDGTGRVGALGGGMERLSYSSGVWIGGLLAEYVSYSTIGLLGFAGCMLGLVFGFPSLFRALHRREASAAEAAHLIDKPLVN